MCGFIFEANPETLDAVRVLQFESVRCTPYECIHSATPSGEAVPRLP